MVIQSQCQQFYHGFLACLPTLLGYWAIGFACGALGDVNGFNTVNIAIMSCFIYSGSAQFLFYQLTVNGSNMIAIILAVGFINLRYLMINTYMAAFFSRSNWWQKLIAGFLTTDETFAVASQYARKNDNHLPFFWFLGLNLTAWLNWIASTVVGSIFATLLPNYLRDALSFSLVGMFIGLLLLNWFDSRTRLIDVGVLIVSIIVTFVSKVYLMEDKVLESLISVFATLIAASVGMIILMIVIKRKSKNYD